MSIDFEWDSGKALINLRKHGVAFEAAEQVFFDPFVLMDQDRIEGGEYRWQAIGMANGILLLCVAHTSDFQNDGVELIRIISARPASKAERKRYAQQDR